MKIFWKKDQGFLRRNKFTVLNYVAPLGVVNKQTVAVLHAACWKRKSEKASGKNAIYESTRMFDEKNLTYAEQGQGAGIFELAAPKRDLISHFWLKQNWHRWTLHYRWGGEVNPQSREQVKLEDAEILVLIPAFICFFFHPHILWAGQHRTYHKNIWANHASLLRICLHRWQGWSAPASFCLKSLPATSVVPQKSSQIENSVLLLPRKLLAFSSGSIYPLRRR